MGYCGGRRRRGSGLEGELLFLVLGLGFGEVGLGLGGENLV